MPSGDSASVYLPKGSLVLTNVGRTLPDQASPHGDSDKVSLLSRGTDLEGWEVGSGPCLGGSKEARVCRQQSLL